MNTSKIDMTFRPSWTINQFQKTEVANVVLETQAWQHQRGAEGEI